MIFQSLGLFPAGTCGCSSVVEHLLAKERVESSNLFIRLILLSESFGSLLYVFCKSIGSRAVLLRSRGKRELV